MTDIVQPVPITLLPVPPRPTDTPEEFDAKSFATLDAQVVMVPQVNAAADATWKNAKAGEERAIDANQAKNAAEIARGQAQTAANSAVASAAVVGRWDKLVLGTKDYFPTSDNDGQPLLVGAEFFHATLKARYSWTGTAWAIGTNVTAGVSSINGKAGTVNLGIADVVAPGDIVAYGATEAAARAKIKASLDYSRGQQTLISSQTISRSMFGTANYVWVELWAGSASGNASISNQASNITTVAAAGGEGGEYLAFLLAVASLPATIDCVVGAGGAGVTITASGTAIFGAGLAGGDTSFNGILALGGIAGSLFGGLPNAASAKNLAGKNAGAGGGFAPNSNTSGMKRVGGSGEDGSYGGGGGGASYEGQRTPGRGGISGSGGAGVETSVSGSVGNPGVAPSGGGGGIRLMLLTGTVTSGAGARGQIRLTWF